MSIEQKIYDGLTRVIPNVEAIYELSSIRHDQPPVREVIEQVINEDDEVLLAFPIYFPTKFVIQLPEKTVIITRKGMFKKQYFVEQIYCDEVQKATTGIYKDTGRAYISIDLKSIHISKLRSSFENRYFSLELPFVDEGFVEKVKANFLGNRPD